MSEITTVSTKGQVTIPQEIRQFLQIKVGDKVAFTLPILQQKKTDYSQNHLAKCS